MRRKAIDLVKKEKRENTITIPYNPKVVKGTAAAIAGAALFGLGALFNEVATPEVDPKHHITQSVIQSSTPEGDKTFPSELNPYNAQAAELTVYYPNDMFISIDFTSEGIETHNLAQERVDIKIFNSSAEFRYWSADIDIIGSEQIPHDEIPESWRRLIVKHLEDNNLPVPHGLGGPYMSPYDAEDALAACSLERGQLIETSLFLKDGLKIHFDTAECGPVAKNRIHADEYVHADGKYDFYANAQNIIFAHDGPHIVDTTADEMSPDLHAKLKARALKAGVPLPKPFQK